MEHKCPMDTDTLKERSRTIMVWKVKRNTRPGSNWIKATPKTWVIHGCPSWSPMFVGKQRLGSGSWQPRLLDRHERPPPWPVVFLPWIGAPRHQIWEAVGCISVEKSNMKIPADAAAQVVHLAAVSSSMGDLKKPCWHRRVTLWFWMAMCWTSERVGLDGYHNCHHMVITIVICQHMVTLHMDNIGWLSKDDTNRTGTQLSFISFIFKAEWFSNFSRLGPSKLEVERFSKNAHEFGSSKF